MPQREVIVLLVMGAIFIVLGIGSIMWGRVEEANYYNTILSRPDVREFLERLPVHPQPGSLKIGGRIAVSLGALMLIAAVIIWLLGSAS